MVTDAVFIVVQSPRILSPDAKVSELLLDSGEWNAQMVREAFLPFEAEAILAMARPNI